MSQHPLQAYVGVQQPIDKEMARILLDAAKEAEKIAAAGGSSALTAAQARIKARELRDLSGSLWGQITPTMTKGMKAAAVAASGAETFVGDVLEKATGQRFRALEQALAFNAQNSVLRLRAKAANGIPLSEQVYKTKALSDGWVDREIKRSLALQESAKQLAARVSGMIRPDTPGGVSYAAMRLARSEINNAFHQTQIATRSEEPWTQGMRWNLSSSHPKPDECNEYAEGQHTKDLPVGVFLPREVPSKPHPNCLCFLTTETIDEDAFLDGFFAGKYNTYIDRKIYSSGIGTEC